ncbi:hypothetical protein ACMA1I_17560 [Pontibacter sp. 13R65]|uniref:hypothetical protein n=1 Tax=Pontibacter sp. 13R65 TaxID=3127458 RepID=UPI00301B9E57
MKDPTLNGVFTWVDESTVNRKKKEDLFLDNVILHFSKDKGPMPSREWVYMVDVPEDILKQNNIHIREMLHQGRTVIEDESLYNKAYSENIVVGTKQSGRLFILVCKLLMIKNQTAPNIYP